MQRTILTSLLTMLTASLMAISPEEAGQIAQDAYI